MTTAPQFTLFKLGSCTARRQDCIQGLSEATAQDQLGGLGQGAVRRAEASATLYVAYTHRIAISNRRLVSADQNGATFKYKDYTLTRRD